MTPIRAAFLCLTMIALPTAPALALTAEEVWADWMRIAREAEVAISATTQREGERLVVSAISIPLGPAGEKVDLLLDRIEFQDLPDGRVAVLLPPSFPVTIEGPGPDGRERVVLSASAPALSLVVSGIGQTSAFELKAPSLALTLDRIEPPPDGGTAEATLALADLRVDHRMDLQAERREVFTTAGLGAVRGELTFDDGKDQRGRMTLDLGGMSGELTAVLPPGFDPEKQQQPDQPPNPLAELLDFFADGLRLAGAASFTDFALDVDMTGSVEPGQVEIAVQSGKLAAGLEPARAFYEVALGRTTLAGRNLPDLEFPEIAMGLDEAGYDVSVGIGDLVSPQEARLGVRMIGLNLPPEVWAEADPSGALGSGPISWALEVTARYALGPEMLAPDWVPVPGAIPPLDIIEVALKTLDITGAGVRIGGSGAVTLDESDLVTFEGFPVPEGKLSFTAEGVNGLIDRLSAAGMVTEEELSGFRLALMFIAKPGPTLDTLVSSLEFRDKGIFLNGVKMR